MYKRKYTKSPAKEEAQVKEAPRTFPTMTLTVDELAEELRVSKPTAYRIVRQEGFPSFSIGNRILVNRAGLQKWIDHQSSLPLEEVS